MNSNWTPADKLTWQIMGGRKTINPTLLPLADFIERRFCPRPVNIIYDIMPGKGRLCLHIHLKYEHEKRLFFNDTELSYDSSKQQLIATHFREMVEQTPSLNRKIADLCLNDDIWVDYSAFEPLAKAEANLSISSAEIISLKSELQCPDLWEITRSFSATTFFLYTEAQRTTFEQRGIKKLWSAKFFELLKPYDTFSYFEADEFTIYMDSKENFDLNYNSNWYYFYK